MNNFMSFFWRYIYISLNISLICSFVTVSELFCGEIFYTFVILSTILLPIKSRVISAVLELLYLRQFLVHL